MPDPTFHFIVVVDVEGFGRRTNPAQASLRATMYEVMQRAFEDAHLDWEPVVKMDRGDGILMLVPTTASTITLAGTFVNALNENLREKSRMFTTEHQMRMRVALHQGNTQKDANGWVGEAINTAARLVDAQPLRAALKAASGSMLAFIVSDEIYQGVVRHGYRYIDTASFASVQLDIKELHERAWIQVPGRSYPPGVEAEAPSSHEARPETQSPPSGGRVVNFHGGNMTVEGNQVFGDQTYYSDPR